MFDEKQKFCSVKLSDNKSTDGKWKQFCLLYLKSYNATQAYMDVYNSKYNTASVNGSKLLRNAKIKSYLRIVKEQQEKELFITSYDVIKELAKIAFSNIGDYVYTKTVSKKGTNSSGNEVVEKNQKILVKDKKYVDWSVVKDIHYGRNGLYIRLYDKLQALSELLKRLPDSNEELVLKHKLKSISTNNSQSTSQVAKLLSVLEKADKKYVHN